jgi:DNA invertase Pin-like site-specific DNA recombinase
MRLIGYARVSTDPSALDRQLGALRAAGCKRIFAEKAAGRAVKGRPELERAIDELGATTFWCSPSGTAPHDR